ncbi:hypothetical protein [Zymobacter palmae]|uniref:Uncharacterized protein conserved in archaea n=1 Tax=Zymobacter palmae TaxID=33074 RepID=A0A348HF85_9GAMM|nr:hypothetical protein [Zymobacter palmae]BBG30287.1 uncharacterized protein conserved in archaea [Zymobacter palmae]
MSTKTSPDSLLQHYAHWQRFLRQDRLDREHKGAVQKMAAAGVSANKVVEAYRSMATRGATEGACYRTLFDRRYDDQTTLACEGWLFIRRIIQEGGSTRVRASLVESFTLTDGIITPEQMAPQDVTLELFDEIAVDRGMAVSCRVDRRDDDADSRFVTFTDAVRNYRTLLNKD